MSTGMEEVATWSCYWCQQVWKKSLHGAATGANRYGRSHYMELLLVPTGMEEVTTWSCYWCQQAWKKSLHGTATGANRYGRSRYMELQLVPTGMEEVATWSCYWCQQAWKKSLHGAATGINRHARWPWPGNEASLGCQVTIPRMWGVGIRLDYRYIVLSPDQIFHLVEQLTEKQGWTFTKKTRVVSNCR